MCDYTAAQKPQLLRHMEQHASFKVRMLGGARTCELQLHSFLGRWGERPLSIFGVPFAFGLL